jgi:dihydroorotase
MSHDLVLKNGTVVDPAGDIHGRYDVAIRDGRIAAVGADLGTSSSTTVIDVDGLILTPGLIDIHTHVAETIMPIAVTPDEAGVRSGVTAVSDAGSVGYANYDAFKHLVVNKARTDIFCFLHLCPTGQAVSPEIGWEHLDPERVVDLVEKESDVIRGIKIRANGPAVVNPDLKILTLAKKLCVRTGLPLMVHAGLNSEESVPSDVLAGFNRDMLSMLGAGDILPHAYTARRGGLVGGDDSLLPELIDASKRGVVIDAAPAKSHFSFERTRIALENGLYPTTLSTDITRTNYQGPALFSLPVVMSKFLALGLTIDEVVEKTTIAPARILKEDHQRGSLRVGFRADITVFELITGTFLFSDGSAGNTLRGSQLLEPRTAIKDGESIPASSRYRDHVPGEPVPLTRGA